MAESTLALTLDDLSAQVGLFLGWGIDRAAWDANKQAFVTSCVKSGLSCFYFPEPLPGESAAYNWSFLRPTATLTLASGASAIALPDDFGGLEGEVTAYAGAADRVPWEIKVVGEGLVRMKYATSPGATGRPEVAAVQPIKGTAARRGQRAQLYFFPAADADYSVELPYYVLADALGGDFPYALGGAAHSETILESCLAVAEQRLDDSMGVHTAKFQARLAASVSLDRRSKPQTLGYNGDRSDGPCRGDRHGLSPVTVNGVSY